MNKILDEGKKALIVVGGLLTAVGQALTYLPVLPTTQRGLALASSIVGMGSAVVGAMLQVVEKTQTSQPVDVAALAAQLHAELDKAHSAANPAPVDPAPAAS